MPAISEMYWHDQKITDLPREELLAIITMQQGLLQQSTENFDLLSEVNMGLINLTNKLMAQHGGRA